MADILLGSAVVTLTLLTFIGKCVPLPEDIIVYKIINQSVFTRWFYLLGLVWLREQILHGGGPVWLEPEVVAAAQPARQAADQLPAAGQPAQPGQVIPADQDAQVYIFPCLLGNVLPVLA